ncbi:hypothetical protein AVEN_177893-1 [Araneus ventricosus]|uniref:Uncharacterized protein n=1 Tax=Araneus ventricosus TaxID=182803 RepID=A0A4Y2DIP1_ARAVE|nr:hypothetical protein AVEN_177893-1 [Araneus ventricosus]
MYHSCATVSKLSCLLDVPSSPDRSRIGKFDLGSSARGRPLRSDSYASDPFRIGLDKRHRGHLLGAPGSRCIFRCNLFLSKPVTEH